MEERIADMIKAAKVFCRCSREEATNLLAPFVKTERYSVKQHLYQCGNAADGVRIILEGKVKVYQINSFGKELIIEIVLPKGSIGWENVFSQDRYILNAIAIEDVTVLNVPMEDVRFLCGTNPDFASALAEHLCNKLLLSWSKQMSFLYQPVRQRVANSLLSLYRAYGNSPQASLMPANRRELANIAGVTRETATRLVKEFEHEKLLSIHGEEVLIKDPQRIEDIGHQYV